MQGVPGVKRKGRKADNSPPSSTEVKDAWCLVKHRDIYLTSTLPLDAGLAFSSLEDCTSVSSLQDF
jgi:hypothetical protein